MEEQKIIKEQNGESKEISQEELKEISSNPDYQVSEKEENGTEKRVSVQERLYD